MPRTPLDDATADRLLTGALHPEDAPPGYGQVAALVGAARGAPHPINPTDRAAAVSAITAAISSAPGNSLTPQRKGNRHMISRLLTLKALGVALPAVALTAGSAAAATGSLPTPAQAAVASALSTVGVHVPNGHDSTDSTNSSAPASAVGPDASGPAKYGLCTAWKANNGHASSHSVAFSNLQKAAIAANETVTQFCAGVTPPSGSNTSNDTKDSSGANNDTNSATTPSGPPSSTPADGTAPEDTPAGPPSSTPASKSAPVDTPAGPPSSTPVGK
jgi:hypothetical protein